MQLRKIAAIGALFLVVAMSTLSTAGVINLRESSASDVNGFNVINAIWGTTSAPISAAPGDRGDTLTLTLQYVFSATAETIQGYLELPSGFSLYNGSTTAFASTTGTYPTGSMITMSFQVYISSTLSLGSYVIPLDLSWTAAGYGYLLNDTVPVTVQVEGRPQLYFSSSDVSLSPGLVNQIPILISDNGSGAASSIFVTATSQVGGILNTIPEIQNLVAGGVSGTTLQVYVPVSAAGSVLSISLTASYKDPYGNSETASQTINSYVSTVSQPKLSASTSVESLTPGQTNNVMITITNGGSIALSEISTTIAFSPSSITLLGSSPYIPILDAGSSVTEDLSLYIPSTVSSSAVSVTIASSFLEPDGTTGTASQTLGFYTTAYVTTSYNTTVAVVPINTNVTAGQESKVTFQLENTGTAAVYTPTIALTVSSPLIIVTNSSFTFQQVLSTKASALYEATLTASPSSTIGTYSGMITVTYTDQDGNSHSQSLTMGFILSGTITLTAESESVTQSSRSLAISGTILNEGTASAYYASAVACVVQSNATAVSRSITTFTGLPAVNTTTVSGTRSISLTTTRSITGFTGSFTGPGGVGPGGTTSTGATPASCPSTATSSYIGEIDPNSPIAFTASATFTPTNTSSSATVVVVITYQNTFGVSASTPIDKTVTLTAAATTTAIVSPTGGSQDSNSHEYVKVALYGVVAAVIVATIAGGIYVRRNNAKVAPSEQKVV